jgi:hypothetical protein
MSIYLWCLAPHHSPFYRPDMSNRHKNLGYFWAFFFQYWVILLPILRLLRNLGNEEIVRDCG